VQHMNALLTVPGTGKAKAPVTVVNHPVRYDGATAEVQRPPQQLGAQTTDVLAELGFTAAEIRALAEERIIATAAPS